MKFLKVELFIPSSYEAKLVNELNEYGYLNYEKYDYCYSSHPVNGHFRPKEGAEPFVGEVGKLETVEEIKLTFRIRTIDLNEVKRIISLVHPYEEPVVFFTEIYSC